jgi:hypothetical protein
VEITVTGKDYHLNPSYICSYNHEVKHCLISLQLINSMETPDLDGYPILRIDQLTLIDVSTLEKSVPDAKALMENLREESNKSGGGKSQKSMIKYLQKQLDQTVKEIATRAAEDRVNTLLSGTKQLLVRAISPSLDREKRPKEKQASKESRRESPPVDVSSSLSSTSGLLTRTNSLPPSSLQKNDPPPVAFYEPIPLPSQLAAASHKPKLSRAQAREQQQMQAQETAAHEDKEVHMSRSAGSQRPSPPSSLETNLLTSRSSGAVSSPIHQHSHTPGDSDSTSDNPGTSTSTSSKPRRRPRSGNAAASTKPKSIYAQSNLTGASAMQNKMSIQQNFGNEFMVGATEKKKRFYPKKVVPETDAERRRKLREKG